MTDDVLEAFWTQVQEAFRRPEMGPCWEWTGSKDRNGYGRFRFHRKGQKVDKKAHRLSYELEYGQVPALLRHRCDNPPCIRPGHLLPGTHQSNAIDARDRGLLVFRPKTLAETDHHEIWSLRDAGMPYPAIAARFGVSYETVRRVLLRRVNSEV